MGSKKTDSELHVVEVIDDKGTKRKALRSAYSGTVAKGSQIDLSREQVLMIGRIILEQIREEIAEDTQKAGGSGGSGAPASLPQTKRFAESFQFQVSGDRTLQFTSDWPTARAHTMGRDKDLDMEAKNKGGSGEFPMWWLTKPNVPYARIVTSEGKIIVVSTPNPGDGEAMWVHPGFRRYSFLERGIRKGKQKALEALAGDILSQMLSEHGLFQG